MGDGNDEEKQSLLSGNRNNTVYNEEYECK